MERESQNFEKMPEVEKIRRELDALHFLQDVLNNSKLAFTKKLKERLTEEEIATLERSISITLNMFNDLDDTPSDSSDSIDKEDVWTVAEREKKQ
ncbi:MAG: hypothetical protein V1891_02570 [bacterium]